ncbi:TetR/AcrR family transcriptional regulator [Shewanella sp.]|uniref:TetR/AcrR family transcriptional regulator n=1 Tax=Shewanella sp. TaxID=50422 RepID=UPI0040539E5A
MKTSTQDTRQHILDTGYQLIASRGFASVGLSELLKHAQVPKGSFYHYFKSKEQFGEALIKHYFDDYQLRLNSQFGDKTLPAYTRLIEYWQCWMASQADSCSSQKCLVVKLSAEVADLSEPMRLALLKGTQIVQGAISDCIQAGIDDGSVKETSPNDTAKLLYHLWIGASLMAKLSKTDSGLQQAMDTTELLLKPSG